MNKQKRLNKALIKHGVTFGGIVVIFAGLYFGTDAFLSSTLEQKTEAERTLSQDQGQVTALNSQLDKSGIAEKRFMETQSQRVSYDFSANTESLKDWLKNAIAQYRLSNNFKLSLTVDKPTSIKELSGSQYEAVEHPGMKIEFSSISDTHAFSFIDDLVRNAPGFIVIESVSMKRSADIDKNAITMIRSGAAPYTVDTKMTFNWIGLSEKAGGDKSAGDKAGAPAAAGGK